MSPSKRAVILAQLALLASVSLPDAPARPNGRRGINAAEMRTWLTHFASDELEGRATFSEGLGLAAAYIAGHLRSWGVRPGGDNGSYFRRVRVLGVKTVHRSSITVETAGRRRTFKDGEGLRFPANVGVKRALESSEIEFVGYALNAPQIDHNDFSGRNVRGKVAVWLGGSGPKAVEPPHRRLLSGRARNAIEQEGAIASIGPFVPSVRGRGARPEGRPADEARETAERGAQPAPAAPARPTGFGGPPIETPDFTTAERLDKPRPPMVTAEDDFFEFLFSGQEVSYSDLKAKASRQEPLPPFTLRNVKITFDLEADYRVVRTQLTRNVVGIIDGRDGALKNTYVAFGAHYDHVGYSEGEIVDTPNGKRRAEPRGRVTEGHLDDRIWNGADDDGSGSIVLLAVAKAFAHGSKPRRSLVFVWHTGEERGLWGSRHFVDYPAIPLERAVAHVNMDMVGRNRDNRPDENDTVYLVGSDRISTELHNLTIDSNDAIQTPLKLDFELNDPSDLEGVYFRSDHYSYAATGIPIVFLTTALHPDYHANTDTADKINYEKMTRIAQLVYELGMRVGNLDHPPARDNRGARAGRGSSGKLAIR